MAKTISKMVTSVTPIKKGNALLEISKKTKNQHLKLHERYERKYTEKDIQVALKHVKKRCNLTNEKYKIKL